MNTKPVEPSDMMTIAEVLKALRISRMTYYRMVAAGRLHPRKINPANGRVVIPRLEIEKILS